MILEIAGLVVAAAVGGGCVLWKSERRPRKDDRPATLEGGYSHMRGDGPKRRKRR